MPNEGFAYRPTLGTLMTRPALMQLISDLEDRGSAARWPVPFDDDDIDLPSELAWWQQ